MTEHESDPRHDPERGTEPDSGPAPEQPRPYGAEQPTAQQPTLPTNPQPVSGTPVSAQPTDAPQSPWQAPAAQHPQAGYPQPGPGYPHYNYPSAGYGQPGHPTSGSGQAAGYPTSGPGQAGYPAYPAPGSGQAGTPGQGGYPAPGSGQPGGYPTPGSGQHGTPIPWAGGGPGLPPPPGQHWPPAPGPQRPNRIGRWIAGVAVALVLLLGAGLVGGVIGAALQGNDNDNARARAAAAPVINRSSLAEIAQKVEPSIVSVTTGSGEGSGVVLTADGFVLTNNHVVASASGNTVQVVFDNGKRAGATIVGTDPKSDLAVVKASGVSGLSPATFGDSNAVQVGDTVLALGSPLGLQGSVTAGIISAKDRTIRTQSEQQPPNPFDGGGNQQPTATSLSGLLQTDAPINPGNSGGALVNTNGEVIGINTAIATSGQGNGSIGVGFAIPSAKAEQVANALRNGEKVSHAALGVQVADQENGNGAIISAVTPNSAAAKAGLQQGDVVTNFGGEPINSSDELVAAVQSRKVGDQVQLTYTRNGAEHTATVTLTEAS